MDKANFRSSLVLKLF